MPRIVSLIAIVAIAASACSSPGDEATPHNDPQLGGSPSIDAPSASPTQEDALLEFVRCMREQGVDVGDPIAGPGGGFVTYSSEFGSGADEFEAAYEECREFAEQAGTFQEPPSPAEVEENQRALLEFARCMRANRIDMPDPEFGPGGSTTYQFPTGDLPQDELQAIQERCADEAGMEPPVVFFEPSS